MGKGGEMMTAVLEIAGALGIIGGAAVMVFKVIMPVYRIVKRVEILEDKSQKDYEALQKQAEFDKAICKGMVAMLNHEIDGNHVDKLKSARDELNNYLIGR